MELNFPSNKWDKISNEAKDLLKNMLSVEDKRFSARQVLSHPWFKVLNDELSWEKFDFSSQFKDINELKKNCFNLYFFKITRK